MKLIWKVTPKPTGPYRSFFKRDWPTAWYNEDQVAASVSCEHSYCLRLSKTDDHAELIIRLADYSKPSNPENNRGFTWIKVKKPAKTLAEAKEVVAALLVKYPSLAPKGK